MPAEQAISVSESGSTRLLLEKARETHVAAMPLVFKSGVVVDDKKGI